LLHGIVKLQEKIAAEKVTRGSVAARQPGRYAAHRTASSGEVARGLVAPPSKEGRA
jgi:NADH-quinone oxidoreductase subunit B